MAWLLPRSWPGTHLFTGLWLRPPVAQGFDLTKSQSSGGRDKTIKAAMLQGALDSLQLPCSSSSACGEGQSPTRVTSDPLTLHIKASSCLPGTASWYGGKNPFSRGSWEGLTELAGDEVLGAAAAAGETGGWGRALPATQMCHFLQGSQQDGLTRIL